MPSQAFQSFEYNLTDVDRLIETHETSAGPDPGKKGLGHLTRSGVVMLCACWELYVEQVIIESVTFFSKELDLPTELPKGVQKELSLAVKNSKHELKPLFLAGDGWKTVYLEHATLQTDGLNTPKSEKVNELFLSLLGIPKISDQWTIGANAMDKFVTTRGDIAHRGRQADYIRIGDLRDYREQVKTFCVDTDNFVSDFARQNTPHQYKPWNVTK